MKARNYILIFISLVILTVVGYLAGVRDAINNSIDPMQIRIDSLRKADEAKELRFNKVYDSIKSENSAIRKANILIDKFISKTIQINEANKKRSIIGSDSVKLFVSDSMLRANGYK